MRTAINTIMAIAATTTAAFAANDASAQGLGMLAWGFIGFFALVLVSQLIPALMLLIGAVKGLAAAPKAAVAKKNS